jgi:hypothetical protein
MAQEIRQVTTSYVHPTDPNLLNIHKAMVYRDDEPHLRVTLGSDNITITGDVNLVDTVTVNSTPEDPVHTHITEVGTSGVLSVPYMPIGGTVELSTSTLAALESVSVQNTVTVTVNNFPTTSTVYQGTIPWVTTITNWPALQYVNGVLYAVQSGTWNVNVTSLPAVSGTVAVSSLPAITGTVIVSNFTSTVRVDNFPTSVTVTNFTSTVFVSNTLTISNTSFAVTNFPTTSTVYQGTNPWTITGTVAISSLPEVEIKNDSGNPVPISGTVNATLTGTAAVTLGAAATDAFGRLRVSNPYTLFDGGLRYFDNTYKWDQVDTGSVTSTFLPNESSILMNATGAGSAIRQTKQVFSYQPGKSLLVLLTFVMNTPTAGVTQRAGYFGAENGVYFEVAGTTKNLVIRKYTSGSVDDTTEKFPQSLWNGDKLDGTGASGITLDVTKAQIFWTDIEWLGVGTVRCGFVVNGQFIVCHSFHHANILNKVYMTSATLPLRYELISTGPAATMRAICSTVMSEGGHSNRSFTRAIGTALTGKNLSHTVYRPLVCLRMKSTALDSIVVPTAFDVFGLQLAAFAYRIILNPTLTDANWTSADTDSTVEYDISATALSGGKTITQGVFVGSNKGGSAMVTSNEIDFSQQLGRTIAGVSDIWCLAALATTNNDDAVGIVNWQEHN